MKIGLKKLISMFGLKVSRIDSVIGREEFNRIEDINEAYLTELIFLFQQAFSIRFPENSQRNKLIGKLIGTNPSEALHVIKAIHEVAKLEGDICEFGVAQGATSALIANEILNSNKIFWLFDSFEGLPSPTEKDVLKDDILNLGTIDAYTGRMSHAMNEVQERLNGVSFPKERTSIVKGFIEESIKLKNVPEVVSFAYVDFDFYEPIKLALNFLDSTLQVGGIIIVDDYNWFSTGAKSAVDEFFNVRGCYQLEVPDDWIGHFAIIKKTT